MSKFFECKVKYRKTTENGVQKVVNESFIVNAISFSDAETRINEQMKAYISEEFRVTNIKVANFSEIHAFENCEKWFKSKVSLLVYNDDNGKESKTNIYLLVQANDAKEAYNNTLEVMITSMGSFSIPSVSESNIIDVFDYVEE